MTAERWASLPAGHVKDTVAARTGVAATLGIGAPRWGFGTSPDGLIAVGDA